MFPRSETLGIPAFVDQAAEQLCGRITSVSPELRATLELDGARMLRLREGQAGIGSPSQVSANGHSRLVHGRDGWIALSLARKSDHDVLFALLGRPPGEDPWRDIEEGARNCAVSDFVDRGRLLGLPIAVVPNETPTAMPPIITQRRGAPLDPRSPEKLKVSDLSSLWAGPLVAKILACLGADVTKIESKDRLDGARLSPNFYSVLHSSDQRTMEVDFENASDVRALREELETSDVVIEGSRPRALEQLGLGPTQVLARPGSVWLSVTGYGRMSPQRDWVAFGDDGAAAGGLISRSNGDAPEFMGDAIADPLTGLIGALGVLESLRAGGGHLIDVALQRSAAWIANQTSQTPHREIA
jgi:hypothetical protein